MQRFHFAWAYHRMNKIHHGTSTKKKHTHQQQQQQHNKIESNDKKNNIRFVYNGLNGWKMNVENFFFVHLISKMRSGNIGKKKTKKTFSVRRINDDDDGSNQVRKLYLRLGAQQQFGFLGRVMEFHFFFCKWQLAKLNIERISTRFSTQKLHFAQRKTETFYFPHRKRLALS